MLDFLTNSFAMLFVTIDPIGLAPMFLAVTAGATTAERRSIAIKTIIISTATLMVFFVAGQSVLSVLGISQPAFQVAGGLLLFIIAVEMVFEHRTKRKAESAEKAVEEDNDLSHVAVFPLAIPLIAGPASISALILLTAQAPGAAGIMGLLAVMLVVLIITFFVFILADKIEKVMGSTVQLIITRLFGVLLAALSVQFVADGLFNLIEAHF
ncbi:MULTISPECIES: MarC family protein [Pseudovibrio]|uniref:MarC family protein n=1 Tax=Stappiaceae TaxID=2821832 RepID=UPI0023650279|nr:MULTISPECIES: MarC family protein [Pseudovibrio]MDD7908766.1 MarC family protein [Pseudovibrio exalbescens]MDX5592839.1 MarC family protein [Pseudovibrio sp. SPO723]